MISKWPILFSCFVAVVMVSVLAAVAWRHWQYRHVRRLAGSMRGLRRSPARYRFRLIIRTTLVVVAAVAMTMGIRYGQRAAWRAGSLETFNRAVITAAVGLQGLSLALLLGRFIHRRFRRDRVASEATRLVAENRTDDAIALLREHIAMDGANSARLTMLGALLCEQEQFEAALQLFREAEKLVKNPVVLRNNVAAALNGLGQRDEALRLLEETAARWPQDLMTACNQCLLFAAAGREQEAFAALERTERIVERVGESRLRPKSLVMLARARHRVRLAQGFPVLPVVPVVLPDRPA